MQYLLDTNIISNLLRDPRGRAAQRLARAGADQVCTSIIVVAELRYGIAKARSGRLESQFEAILPGIDVMPFEPPADLSYGDLRTRLERAGTPIGGNDMLIAAHTLALGLTLVTANEREFSRVPDLRIENWLS